MPRWLTNIPWVRRLLGRGANSDIRPELLQDGYYRDARNMRQVSVDGNTGGVETIKGEQLLYPAPAGTGYVCIGATGANGRVMEFWASENFNQPNPGDNPPIVRIDGVVVAQSENIPYVYNRPLQIAMEERCMGGVAYPADHNSDPLYWAINDLLQNLNDNTGLYFDNYTQDVNAVALGAPIEWPKFKRLVDLVSNGAPTGQYQFFLRLRTSMGDVTNLGPPSPLSSVPRFADVPANNAYPGGRNIGGVPSLLAPTQYGLEYQWRIDNTYGYPEVEVVCARLNDGGGLTGVFTTEIVARFPIAPGLNPPFTFTYPQDINIPIEVVPDDVVADMVLSIHAPKGVELADNRLIYANADIDATVPELVFDEVDGSTTFFLTERLSTTLENGEVINDGYANPVHNTYKKSIFRGEKNGWGVMVWNSVAGKSFVQPITGAENLQAPNRRDPMTPRSVSYSLQPIVAANTDCQSADPVGYVYEAMGQGTFRKLATGPGNTVNAVAGTYPYLPWRPVGPADSERYNTPPNIGRILDSVGPLPGTNNLQTDQANIWAPSHHALGLAVNGMTNFPSGSKAFSVMRTPDAGRVVCQGIGTYLLTDNPIGPRMPKHKDTVRMVFNSADINSGIVPQSILEDMQLNPTQYKLQFVAPLGFYTDIYGYFRDNTRVPNDPITGAYVPDFTGNQNNSNAQSPINAAFAVDMLSYAGIQHDEGQVNVGEPAAGGMGYQPNPLGIFSPGNYVGYGAWRNAQPPNGQGQPTNDQMDYSFWNMTGNDGNSTMVLQSFVPNPQSRGQNWIIDGGAYAYTPGGIDTRDPSNDYHVDFDSFEVRTFHQPWYIINIVRDGADVPNEPTDYIACTTVKLSGCIGIANGEQGQTMELINERVDDCRPRFQSEFRYLYVGQLQRAWLCVSNFNAVPIPTILADIAANGFYVAPDGTEVYGVYQVTQGPDGDFVVFGNVGVGGSPVPDSGDRVVVKYDHTAPVIAFGGSSTVAPSVQAIYDKMWTGPGDNQFDITPGGPVQTGYLPLPYPGFQRNPNYYQPRESSTIEGEQILPVIQSIRQWCVLWDAESRTPERLNLVGPDGPPQQNSESAFPNVHYVMRQYVYLGSPGGFHAQYLLDYPAENPELGGIRFTPGVNFDYAREEPTSGVGPQVGIEINTDGCNWLFASLEVDPFLGEQPGNRTFLQSNVKAISQENGEIKSVAAMLGPNGYNIYCLTQSGVCRVLTNKNILTGASGEEISTQSISNYWGTELWLSRDVGCPDQMWRFAAKGYAPAGSTYSDSWFFPDRNGVYRLTGDTITDILENKYYVEVGPTLKNFPTDYTPQSYGFYNAKYNEYFISVGPQVIPPRPPLQPTPVILAPRLFSYSAQNNEWVGQYDYRFDAYYQNRQQVLGFRDLETYALDQGFTINGQTRVASVTVPFVGNIGNQKEAEVFQVVGDRPDQIELLDENGVLMTVQNEALAALVNPLEANYWLLNINGWQSWFTSVQGTDLRPQGRMFYMRVTWFQPVDSECVTCALMLRDLK